MRPMQLLSMKAPFRTLTPLTPSVNRTRAEVREARAALYILELTRRLLVTIVSKAGHRGHVRIIFTLCTGIVRSLLGGVFLDIFYETSSSAPSEQEEAFMLHTFNFGFVVLWLPYQESCRFAV